jgi:hypothetical protein
MKKAVEYREHAEECIRLAKLATSEDRKIALMNIAETWLLLAQERAKHVPIGRELADHEDSKLRQR